MNRFHTKARATFLLVLTAGLQSPAPVADTAGALQNNPFKRPVFDTRSLPGPKDNGLATGSELDIRAILAAGRNSLVNVAGNIIRVGQEHEGFRLISVEERAVVFNKDGERLRIELDQEDESNEQD